MRILRRIDPTEKNRLSRRIFLADSFEGTDKDPSALAAALEHPYRFRPDHIKELEGRAGGLEARELRKFNQMAEYYVSLLADSDGKADSVLPTRVTMELFNSPLFTYLNSYLQRQIEHFFHKKRTEFVRSANISEEGQTDVDVMRMTRMYNYMKVRAAKYGDKELQGALTNASNKLLSQAKDVIAGYRVVPGTNRVEPISPETQPALKYNQRFLILEVYRLFPEEHRWLEHKKPVNQTRDDGTPLTDDEKKEAAKNTHKVKLMAEDSLKWVIDEMSKDGAKHRNSALLMMFWEFLDMWAETGEITVSADNKQKIQRMVERGNSAQFLAWAKSWLYADNKVLLPIHIKALQEIQDEKFQPMEPDKVGKDLDALSEDEDSDERIKQVKDEIERLQRKVDEEREKSVEEIISGGKLRDSEKGPDLEIRYQELRESIRRLQEQYLDPEDHKKLKKVTEDFETWKTNADVVKDTALDAEIRIEVQKDVLDKGIDLTIPELEKAFPGGNADAYKDGDGEILEEKRTEYFRILRDKGSDVVAKYDSALGQVLTAYRNARANEEKSGTPDADRIKKLDKRIQQYESDIEEFRRIKQRYSSELDLVQKEEESMRRLQEEIRSQVGAGELKDQQKLQKKLQELRTKHGLSDREKQVLQDRYDMFAEPTKNSKELLERYNKGLTKRAREGGLYAADMAVLFHDDDAGVSADEKIGDSIYLMESDDFPDKKPELDEFKKQFKDRVEAFRTDFDAVLIDAFDKAKAIPTPVEISGGDRFAVWNRALDTVLSYGNLLERLDDKDGYNEYVDFYRRRGKEVNIAELINGAVLGNKNKIIGLVETHAGKFGFTGKDDKLLKEFLGQYPRFHTTLALSDTYKQLQSKRDNFEKQTAEINKDSDEVVGKIEALFGSGSWEQMWQTVYPFLDPDKVAIGTQTGQDTVKADFFKLFDAAGKERTDIVGEQYLDREYDPANKEENGRWFGDPDKVKAFLDTYLRDPINDDEKNRLVRQILKMGLHLKGKDEVTEVIRQQQEALVGGESSQLPGKKTLAEVEVQLYPVRDAMRVEMSGFVRQLEIVETALKSDSDAVDLELKPLLLEGQEILLPSLYQHLDSAEALLNHILPGKKRFVKGYIGNLRADVDLIKSRLDAYQADANSGNVDESHALFERIPAMFGQLDESFNVTEGIWKEHTDRVKENQKRIPEAAEFLKEELGLYGENAEETAKQKYKEFYEEYNERFKNYDRNFGIVKNALNQDIKAVESGNMSQEEFRLLHGTDPEEMQKVMFDLEREHTDFKGTWSHYGGKKGPGEFFDGWLERYRDPNRRQGAMNEFLYWGDIKDLAGKMRNGSENFVRWKEEYDKHKENVKKSGGTKFEFRMVSLRALYEMCKDSFELAGRRIERRVERDKAFLGNIVFGEKGMFGLGYEWERKRTEDEEKRVEEFKNQYKRKNMWEKRAMLYRLGKDTADRDEVRALVDLLVEDGTMRWDDPLFWQVLNRLNKNGGPQIPEGLMEKSMGEIKIALRQSCSAIWDDYVFKNWDDSIDGNHQKAVDAVKKEFADMEAMGGREDVLENMLIKWKNGDEDETVSPERFEGLLRAAYDAGKMNGTPDKRWFYLIMGMTVKNGKTGMTLISRTMLDRLDESLLSRMPYFDFFTDKQSYKKDGWIVSPGTPGAETGPWQMSDITKWGEFFGSDGRYGFHDGKNETILRKCNEFFYNNVVESDNALMRVDRMARAGIKEADHDDGEMWFAGMSMQSLTQLFNRTSAGTDQISPDLASRIVDGFGHYMRATYEFIKSGDEEHGPDNDAWRVQKEKRLTRASELMRVAFAGFHTLAGNYWGTDRTEPMAAPRRFWKENLYNIVDNESRINDTFKDLLAESGADLDEYDEIWGSRCAQEISENIGTRKHDPKFKRVSGLIGKILTGKDDDDAGGEGVSSMFDDFDTIQRVIMNYGEKHGGMTLDGDQDFTSLLYKQDNIGGRLDIDY